jgi:hypothetical protein
MNPNKIFIEMVYTEHPLINQREGNGEKNLNFEFEKSRKNKKYY